MASFCSLIGVSRSLFEVLVIGYVLTKALLTGSGACSHREIFSGVLWVCPRKKKSLMMFQGQAGGKAQAAGR